MLSEVDPKNYTKVLEDATKIGLEGEKEFKKALTEINRTFKVLGSEREVQMYLSLEQLRYTLKVPHPRILPFQSERINKKVPSVYLIEVQEEKNKLQKV